MLAVAAACRIQLTPGGRGNQLYHEIIRFYDGDPERLLDGPCGGEPDYWVYRWIRVWHWSCLGGSSASGRVSAPGRIFCAAVGQTCSLSTRALRKMSATARW
jgi:hypothetical protein